MPISSAVTVADNTVVTVKPHVEEITSQDDSIVATTLDLQPQQDLQQQLEELEIVKAYTADSENWLRRIAHAHVTDEKRVNHLTAGVLRGDGKLGVAPALFQSKDEAQVLSVMHVGRSLCGHPNITHGGLLATLLDEITAMTAIPNLPGKSGFTANLNINYRHPCIAEQFIVIHSEITSVEGRKAFVKATLKSVDGTLFADATALFIAPKIAISQLTEQLTQLKNANSAETEARA
ncbi:hypothetical protein BGX26_007071 [Mortierella sp. AD094]|nr:hypothetical protein BGX26_007071 [Mortierella sp. AD094]